MISAFMSLYSRSFPVVITYMLQATEYHPTDYLKWFWRTQNFGKVMKRRSLEPTRPAKLLLMALRIGMAAQVMLALSLVIAGVKINYEELILLGIAAYLAYPILWAHLVVIPLVLGRFLIINPKTKAYIAASKRLLKSILAQS